MINYTACQISYGTRYPARKRGYGHSYVSVICVLTAHCRAFELINNIGLTDAFSWPLAAVFHNYPTFLELFIVYDSFVILGHGVFGDNMTHLILEPLLESLEKH